MKIRKLPNEGFEEGYGLKLKRLYPWEGVVSPPFGSMQGVIPPGGQSKIHNHHEGETFFILKGEGIVRVDHDEALISEGELVYFPPFTHHELTNHSSEEELVFLSIYWEDMKLLAENGDSSQSQQDPPAAPISLILTPPPTPNGPLHLGHVSGPYTAADIYRRFQQMCGRESVLLCGMDDYQSYVHLKAKQLGMTPEGAAAHYGNGILETFRAAGIELSGCYRPLDTPEHQQFVQEFLLQLMQDGHVYEADTQVLYCQPCGSYLSEAFVSGTCPHCDSSTDGNACEQCGQPNRCVDIGSPICKTCGRTPEFRSKRQLMFRLSRFEAMLKEYYLHTEMNAHMFRFCQGLLAQGLPDIPVTQFAAWGTPVPLEGYEDQRLYVWFEMAPFYLKATNQYLAASGMPTTDWETVWCNPKTRITHFFGFDNSFFYAVLCPALWRAYRPDITLPHAFVTNEFLLLDHAKFSTSRNHAVWADEMLNQTPGDYMRMYLSYKRPEREQTNFTTEEYWRYIEEDVYENWQGWMSQLQQKVEQEYNKVMPFAGAWTKSQRYFYEQLNQLTAQSHAAYTVERFSPQRISRLIQELVRMAADFGRSEQQLAGLAFCKEERRTSVALELTAAKALAMTVYPIMPHFGARLWTALGMSGMPQWEEHLLLVPGDVPLQADLSQLLEPVRFLVQSGLR